jgi:hypothetical protein
MLILPKAGLNRVHEISSGSLSAITQQLHDGLSIKWFNYLYIYFLEVHFVFVRSNVLSQSSDTCIRGQLASTLKYDRSVESQHGQCKEKMSPTESTHSRRI